jgi:hypothetical protein
MTDDRPIAAAPSGLVVVVGPCASGKTTLATGLQRLGYDAIVCGQEHSDIPTLWRHPGPGFVVALQVDLPALRRRRDDSWPEWLYLVQQRRLRAAAAAAALRVDTSTLDPDSVLRHVAAHLARAVQPRLARDRQPPPNTASRHPSEHPATTGGHPPSSR